MLARIPCLFVISAAVLLVAANNILISTAANTSKPGCQSQCGNLTIPYPFGIGIGNGCSLGHWYAINCNTSFDPPKPFLSSVNLEIMDISETYIKITNSVAQVCYNSQGNWTSFYPASIDLVTSPFTFSDTLNKFFVLGCDDLALITTTRGRNFISACISLCSRKEDVVHGTCSGIGCCETYIPKGLKQFQAILGSLYNHVNVSSFDSCGYAFLADVESFTFQGSADLSDPLFVNRTTNNVPIVLEWNVGNETTCSQAQLNSSSYACQQNTYCTDVDLGSKGYRCSCLSGFEGNPYLSPGCTDIDECAGPSNPCSNHCTNVPGNYTCSCPKGHHGDGLKTGSACASNESELAVKFALGIGGIGSVIVLSGCYWVFKVTKKISERRTRAKNFSRNGGLLLEKAASSDDTMERTKIFTAKELEKATDHFNESRILGQGGQGTVYKGMLIDGRIVAIKKSKKVDEHQAQQFINEVAILLEINHKNIVKLIGCCLEMEVPLLVYEFVPNGTLSQHIHHPGEDFRITWKMRLQIATDLAGALAYLHSSLSAPIYHRDIKSSNFLLDEKFKAKVADFGISRSVSIDQTHLTTRVQGTFGYLDPEYFHSHRFTDKSDVYSFGVVLVELLTSKPPINETMSQDHKGLVAEFSYAMENLNLPHVLDPQVIDEGKENEIRNVADLASRCLKMRGKYRPTMTEVALVLQDIMRSRQVTPHVEEICLESEVCASDSVSDMEQWSHTNTSSCVQDEIQPCVVVQPLLSNTV